MEEMLKWVTRFTIVPHATSMLRDLWNVWDIRGAILFSLWLQIVLTFMAPIRKSTREKWVTWIIGSAYLLAGPIANYAAGLISNSQRSQSKNDVEPKPLESSDLLAFWAPFLLLHLGGPDTITAFTIEDNQLWRRYLLSLIVQATFVLYAFFQSLPNEKLWIPTLLIFLAGIIKYVERMRAMYLKRFDADPGPNYAKIMEEYAFKRKANLPTRIIMTPEPDKEVRASDLPPKEGGLRPLEVVHYAYKYFKRFRGLIFDLTVFSLSERDENRHFFYRRTPEDALSIIEAELNFIYGSLYTKVEVVYSAPGYIFRFIAFGSVLASLGIFYFQDKNGLAKKDGIQGVDIGITYILLLGAIVLDVISILMHIFSDQNFASIENPDNLHCGSVAYLFDPFLALKKLRWHTCDCEIKNCRGRNIQQVKHQVLATPLVFRRWSGSISAYNLIRYCLKSSSTTIHEFPPSLWEKVVHRLRINEVTEKFGDCCSRVFKKIKRCQSSNCGFGATGFLIPSIKSKASQCCSVVSSCSGATGFLKSTKNIVSQCRSYMYRKMPFKDYIDRMTYVSSEPFTKELWEFIFEELRKKSEFADIPEAAKSISTSRGDWVLTDTETSTNRNKLLKYVSDVPYDESLLLWHIATDLCYHTYKVNEYEEKEVMINKYSHRQFSKILSDYMLHLLVFQPTMMSAIAGFGKIRFRDTCADAERFFQRRNLGPDQDKKAREEILSVNTDVEPRIVKGGKSKSVLFHASMLAKELNRLETEEGEDKWKLLSKVWVELVSYAAGQCGGSTRPPEVSEGGELVNFFWLLMAHFGLGGHFKAEERARAKLIVGK